MRSNYILYWSSWCPLDVVRDCIKKGQDMFKYIIQYLKDYDDEYSIVFIELTEESLKSLPVMMVDNMKCFNKENIDIMVFHTKDIRCKEEKIEEIKKTFEDCLTKLSTYGFSNELLIIKETKYELDNIGKTVGKKNHEIWYHRQFA